MALQEREEELLQQTVADRKAQVLAHKSAIEAVRTELEKVKDEELEAMRRQCDADLGTAYLHVIVQL